MRGVIAIGGTGTAYRLKVVTGGTTTYIGHGSWGWTPTLTGYSGGTLYANLFGQ